MTTEPLKLDGVIQAKLVEQVKASQRARTTHFQRLIDRLYDIENETRQLEFTVVDGYLYYMEKGNRQLVASEDVQRTIINAFHDHASAGHPGTEESNYKMILLAQDIPSTSDAVCRAPDVKQTLKYLVLV